MTLVQPAKRNKIIFFVSLVLLMLGLLAAGGVLSIFLPNYRVEETTLVYVRPTDTEKDVLRNLKEEGHARQQLGWKILSLLFHFQPRTGAYAIYPESNTLDIFRHFHRQWQQPVRWTLPAVRTMDRLAASVAQHLMLDSAQVMQALTDSAFLAPYGYTTATVPALFIPNTYEFYWDISLQKWFQRMVKEHDNFWVNNNRLALAAQLRLTPIEVATLASIVDEETTYNPEKPTIAGLYLNRFRRGMCLQADPTVKFAVADPSLRRIRKGHLLYDSPYNTYLYKGLPPGPIRIASVQGIDAVLHADQNLYLYMCAKEDFSGSHNFAVTFSQHLSNARRYAKALNARGIK